MTWVYGGAQRRMWWLKVSTDNYYDSCVTAWFSYNVTAIFARVSMMSSYFLYRSSPGVNFRCCDQLAVYLNRSRSTCWFTVLRKLASLTVELLIFAKFVTWDKFVNTSVAKLQVDCCVVNVMATCSIQRRNCCTNTVLIRTVIRMCLLPLIVCKTGTSYGHNFVCILCN